jgi:hypothetical protein
MVLQPAIVKEIEISSHVMQPWEEVRSFKVQELKMEGKKREGV